MLVLNTGLLLEYSSVSAHKIQRLKLNCSSSFSIQGRKVLKGHLYIFHMELETSQTYTVIVAGYGYM